MSDVSTPPSPLTPTPEQIEETLGKGFAPDSLLLENLKNIALTPVTIRGLFILLTRLHYSDPDHYGKLKSKLQNFVWAKEAKDRTVLVDYDYNFDSARLDLRPAIFVGTSDFDFKKVVVANQISQTDDRSGELFGKIASTNIIIRHIGKTPDESWALGDLTTQFYMGITKLLQERLKPQSFEVVSLKGSRPFEHKEQEADQNFMVDLIMNFQYNAAWLVVREGHRIKKVTYQQSLADYTVAQ